MRATYVIDSRANASLSTDSALEFQYPSCMISSIASSPAASLPGSASVMDSTIGRL